MPLVVKTSAKGQMVIPGASGAAPLMHEINSGEVYYIIVKGWPWAGRKSSSIGSKPSRFSV